MVNKCSKIDLGLFFCFSDFFMKYCLIALCLSDVHKRFLRSIISIHFILHENLPKVISSSSSIDQSFMRLNSHKHAPV